jgi:ABC-2 type transport system permease protein
MRVAIAEFKKNLVVFFRMKQAVFFTFMLPAVFLTLLGFAFDERRIELKLGIVNNDRTEAAELFIDGLKTAEILQVQLGERAELEQRLRKGDLIAVLELKEGFGDQIVAEGAELDLIYNQSQMQSSRIIFGVLNEMLIQMTSRIPGHSLPINFNRIGVEGSAPDIRYTDFLTPGIIAMSILYICLVPISGFVAARDSQLLKRISLTPIKKSHYLAGQIGFQVYVCFLLLAFLLTISSLLFDFHNRGSYVAVSVLVLVATASFISLAFAIGSMAKDARSATGMVNMAINPMIFLGGVFYSTSILPSFLQPIVKVLPVTYFVDGLRRIMLQGAGVEHLWKEVAILLGWGIIGFIVAVKKMQWVPDADR